LAQFGLPGAANIAFRRTLLRLLLIQVALIATAAIVIFLKTGTDSGLATLYGGAVSIAGALVGGWRIKIATDETATDNTLRMAEFYKATFFRFVVIVALLALGMGVLKLEALGILIGFIAAQLGYFFARPMRAR
jgi:ATP synthase protein I